MVGPSRSIPRCRCTNCDRADGRHAPPFFLRPGIVQWHPWTSPGMERALLELRIECSDCWRSNNREWRRDSSSILVVDSVATHGVHER